MWTEFHFLRPYWFLALLPLAFLLWRLAQRHLINKHWESVCDPALLPHILVGRSGARTYTNISLVTLASLLTVFALAGPTWERLPQPVFQKESALVIALDLSYSMYADDIKPSRLERARFKIADLLKLRHEGQTALLVYAGSAFTVTPLTDDIKTINSQLSALSPAIMPAPGSHTGIALNKAVELLIQAGIRQGHILFVTDEIGIHFENEFSEAKHAGYTVSILGVGTEEGVPVPLSDGGFLKDRTGTIVLPKLNQQELRQLANAGGGYFENSRLDDSDIERLNRLFNSGLESNNETESQFETDRWQEFGPWLVLLIIPIVALSFRRGYLVILVCLLVQHPDEVMALEWDELWLNENQRAMRALQQEQFEASSELFDDEEWKAAAKYRAGDFSAAEKLLQNNEDERSIYNKANALAKQGRYEEAMAAYDKVLESQPEHEDAIYNRDLIKKELEKQQQNQQQSGSNNDSENQEQQGSQSQQQSDNNQQQQDQQQSNSDKQQQQQGEQSSSEQESADQKQEQQQQQQAEAEQKKEEQQAGQQRNEQDDEESNEQKEEQSQAVQQAMNDLDEEQQATEQWLRRIPDDPSGLLRRKFKNQYQQQQQQNIEGKYW